METVIHGMDATSKKGSKTTNAAHSYLSKFLLAFSCRNFERLSHVRYYFVLRIASG